MSVRSDLLFNRAGLSAAIGRVRAAGAERTAGRKVRRIRRKTLDRVQPLIVTVHGRDRTEQTDGVRMGRMMEDLFLRTELDDVAGSR